MTQQPTDRPLVTFALFAYNQEKYIREAVEGAFSQTHEPLEIILSDDCSTDTTFEIMQKMAASYDGLHQISVRQNDSNLGIAGHVNRVFAEAHGQILITAAGDDIAAPSRATDSVRLFELHPSASAVELGVENFMDGERIELYENASHLGEDIMLINANDFINGAERSFIGAARAYKRKCLIKFPDLKSSLQTEDTPLLLRSIMSGPIATSLKPVVKRRIHDANLSWSGFKSVQSVEAIDRQYQSDFWHALEIKLLTSEESKRLQTWANGNLCRRYLYAITSEKNRRLGKAFEIIFSRTISFKRKIGLVIFVLKRSFLKWEAKFR